MGEEKNDALTTISVVRRPPTMPEEDRRRKEGQKRVLRSVGLSRQELRYPGVGRSMERREELEHDMRMEQKKGGETRKGKKKEALSSEHRAAPIP